MMGMTNWAVRFLHDYVQRKSLKLYQQDQQISIDKEWHETKADIISQKISRIRNKMGHKHLGVGTLGLGNDACMKLCKSFFGQGYISY